jgi:phosphate transport system substrate-binding protein
MKLELLIKRQSTSLLAGVLALTLAACGGGEAPTDETTDTTGETGTTEEPAAEAPAEGETEGGDVLIDGSSTVFPISEAMAEEFMAANAGTRVTVGVSGTGGGFKKFCAGETDIANASRPIKAEEIELCAQNNIEYVEVPVAFDGLSVVVNKENDWAKCMKPDELKKMWDVAAEGTVNNWNQINPDYPDAPLALYGPGTDSGTYDYFVEALLDKDKGSRGDYTASEDDNVIVQGVEADKGGLGFFGFAYYEENADQLGLVQIENAAGECVTPTVETIKDGSYNPLSRPIFFYVSKAALDKPQVQAYVDFNLDAANAGLITEVGYVGLPDEVLVKAKERVAAKTVGSIFEGESSVGVNLLEKL